MSTSWSIALHHCLAHLPARMPGHRNAYYDHSHAIDSQLALPRFIRVHSCEAPYTQLGPKHTSTKEHMWLHGSICESISHITTANAYTSILCHSIGQNLGPTKGRWCLVIVHGSTPGLHNVATKLRWKILLPGWG